MEDEQSNKKKIDLKVKVYKDNRDDVKLRPLMNDGTINAPGNCVFIGRTKSGKSNLLCHILCCPDMYKGYFDIIYLFCVSPSALLINNVKELKEQNIFTDGDPSKLQKILDTQKAVIKEYGWKKAPRICVIADDMAGVRKFMSSKALSTIFYSGSHSKIYTYITVQQYKLLPKSMRANADALFLFHGCVQPELEAFQEEHGPPQLNKKEFIELCQYALDEPFSFMFVNCCIPDKKKKFRKGFETILKIK